MFAVTEFATPPQPTVKPCTYTLDMVKEEARHLIARGYVNRQQPIYVLCQYIPAREWEQVESELEFGGFLLRDRMVDLIGREDWSND